MKKIFLLFSMVILFSIEIFSQAIPKQIVYQGVLKDASGNLINGNQQVTFNIYNNPTGGSALWTETQVINFDNGLFNAYLGSTTPITTVPFDRIHFLGITIASDPELLPRTMLTPSPYSFMTLNVMDNSITTAKIDDGTIINDDISDNIISSEKLINEPGIVESRNSTTHSIASTTMQDIEVVTITIPTDGYIVLEGRSIAWLSGTTAQNELYMQIDETAGGSLAGPYWTKAGLQAYASTGQAFFPMVCQRTYIKTAGTYTFRLEAAQVSGNGAGATTNLYQTQLTAVFYPTAYGTVIFRTENSSGVDESLNTK